MFGLVRKIKREVVDRTIYMEVFGDNKVSYRVTAGRMFHEGRDIVHMALKSKIPVPAKKKK